MRKYLWLVVTIVLYSCDPNIIPDTDVDISDSTYTDTLKNEGTAYVFDINDLPTVKVELSASEWNKLLSYYDQNKNNEEYVNCDFTFNKNGEINTLQTSGLRIRGNTSRRRPEGNTGEIHNATNPEWHHASFTVKFNKFTKGQKIAGLEKINLKWFKDDSMYAREVYCYDLFERFGVWTAPQASYCKFYINVLGDAKTTYFGVYEMVEPVDEVYLKTRKDKLLNANGNLWKANWGADLVNADKSKMGIEVVTLTSTYDPTYDYKSDPVNLEAAKTQLAIFINNFKNKNGDEFKTWLISAMDVELFLKTYAVNVMCGMWDDYWNNSNNFYFYFDTAGKFYFIPYDYDNTLGTSYLMSDSGTRDVMNWGSKSNTLVKKIIDIPEYGTKYKSYLKELANADNDYFYADKSIARIKNWHNLIQDYISNDTGEDMEIIDKPASWGNCTFYRLFEPQNNYFKIRGSNIPN